MTSRLRLVGVVLTPQFMVDDGDNLTPLPVESIPIAAVDWPRVVELFAQAVAVLRAQVEAPPEASTDSPVEDD